MSLNELSRDHINLAAFENVISPAARALLSSEYYSRYQIGEPGIERLGRSATIKGLTLGNYPQINLFEQRGIAALRKIFQSQYVETRVLSGVHATIVSILCLSKPGDNIVSFSPDDGGHFATKGIAESSGRKSSYVSFSSETHNIDLKKSEKVLQSADLVFLDQGMPLKGVNLKGLRGSVPKDCLIVYDASHTLGLIGGAEFQHPLVEGADILQGNTHKTFPGPPRAVICTNNEAIHEKISDGLTNTFVSHSNTASILALYQTAIEIQDQIKIYANSVKSNARLLSSALFEQGLDVFRPCGKETETHIVLVNVKNNHKVVEDLMFAGIFSNARNAWGREFIRFGTQEYTRRGGDESGIAVISKVIIESTRPNFVPHQHKNAIRELAEKLRHIEYTGAQSGN